MKQLLLIFLGIFFGSLATWIAVDNNTFVSQVQNLPTESSTDSVTDIGDESEDIETKIDQINDLAHISPLEMPGNIEELFGNCSPETEREAILERLACNRRIEKAPKYWSKMSDAEAAVLKLLSDGSAAELMEYTSCDAYDLTWYEMLCEYDRTSIQSAHFKNLFNYLEENNLQVTGENKWVRKKPDSRKLRNPRWIMRSRLVLKGLTLKNPWDHTPHPTEPETVVMLEQKLGGRIYIVGIPVTGTFSE